MGGVLEFDGSDSFELCLETLLVAGCFGFFGEFCGNTGSGIGFGVGAVSWGGRAGAGMGMTGVGGKASSVGCSEGVTASLTSAATPGSSSAEALHCVA